MAGHSRWANIKFRKGVQDARRGKLFTKLIREITIAARSGGGGGDPLHNPRLRTAIDKALDANMIRDTIDRAIQRGTGELEGAHYEEVHYEGYGPGGIALIVDCTTDNRTRTVGEVRHAFSKQGGHLGAGGSVSYLFKKTGVLTYPPGTREDRVMEVALAAGADDIVTRDDGSIEVVTVPEHYDAVMAAMQKAGLSPAHAEVARHADNRVALAGEEAERAWRLIEALEDLDDVQAVHSNADFAADFVAVQGG